MAVASQLGTTLGAANSKVPVGSSSRVLKVGPSRVELFSISIGWDYGDDGGVLMADSPPEPAASSPRPILWGQFPAAKLPWPCGISHHGSANDNNHTQQCRLTLALASPSSAPSQPPACNLMHPLQGLAYAPPHSPPDSERIDASVGSSRLHPSLLIGAIDRNIWNAPGSPLQHTRGTATAGGRFARANLLSPLRPLCARAGCPTLPLHLTTQFEYAARPSRTSVSAFVVRCSCYASALGCAPSCGSCILITAAARPVPLSTSRIYSPARNSSQRIVHGGSNSAAMPSLRRRFCGDIAQVFLRDVSATQGDSRPNGHNT
ncbi:hypothetical protein B0H17DRAFT_1124078 [Mycena rosella]|uniref:Uncharacterized protein n=1 Tax=Mycena rosella TaxID=1033263 RepID=A0AAD7H0R0_MYCRO|nr:hypothetical protein B0H17DRAFT_1124078 [Mycena rosella]